jgi:hypothetical protein
MLDACEAELIFEEVFQMPCKASRGQRLPPGVIDPGAVIGIQPRVLMFIRVGVVHFVRVPDIHPRHRAPLVIRAGIEEQRLVGPFREGVGVDKGIGPGRLEAGDRLGGLPQ